MAEINLADIPDERKIKSWRELCAYCSAHTGSALETETIYIIDDIDVYAEYPNDDMPGLTVDGININGMNHTIYNLPLVKLSQDEPCPIYLRDKPITIKDLTFRNIRSIAKTPATVYFIFWNNYNDSNTIHFENVGFYGDIRKAQHLVYPRYNSTNRTNVFKKCHGDLMCVKTCILDNMAQIVESHFVLRWFGTNVNDFSLNNPLINTRIDLYNMNDYFVKHSSTDRYIFPWTSEALSSKCDGVMFYIYTNFEQPVVIQNNPNTSGNAPIAYIKVGKCEDIEWSFNSVGANYRDVIANKLEAANVDWLNSHGFIVGG